MVDSPANPKQLIFTGQDSPGFDLYGELTAAQKRALTPSQKTERRREKKRNYSQNSRDKDKKLRNMQNNEIASLRQQSDKKNNQIASLRQQSNKQNKEIASLRQRNESMQVLCLQIANVDSGLQQQRENYHEERKVCHEERNVFHKEDVAICSATKAKAALLRKFTTPSKPPRSVKKRKASPLEASATVPEPHSFKTSTKIFSSPSPNGLDKNELSGKPPAKKLRLSYFKSPTKIQVLSNPHSLSSPLPNQLDKNQLTGKSLSLFGKFLTIACEVIKTKDMSLNKGLEEYPDAAIEGTITFLQNKLTTEYEILLKEWLVQGKEELDNLLEEHDPKVPRQVYSLVDSLVPDREEFIDCQEFLRHLATLFLVDWQDQKDGNQADIIAGLQEEPAKDSAHRCNDVYIIEDLEKEVESLKAQTEDLNDQLRRKEVHIKDQADRIEHLRKALRQRS